MDSISKETWDKLKLKAFNCKGLDKFGNVYDTVDWEMGPCGKHLHSNCRFDISSSDKLNRSKTRQQKREGESASLVQTYAYTSQHDQVCLRLPLSAFDRA